ncbi:hypothetical protein SUGI_0565410 [Cryptomeria japonica]|uniref:1-aminocyclopropane-1-carboxylate oxidase n=1 Tax=Cryptomeria japonica TaxID=3369 RepID=UPI002408A0E2|nr:1-aminocyclopropane-1-carboxylate oxidase [Cryptomeria japonica]GLJ28691.1 hypothetical protein SUGI_0565410 [Cryptomeria japonica]
MAIPVIDMANFNGEGRADIMASIASACETPGFFQLLNHGIPHSLMDLVKRACSENYKLTREQSFKESLPVKKLEDAMVAEANGNKCAEIENVDWEDAFLISELDASNSWPSQPNNFREAIEEFRKEIYKLAENLLEIISINLGLEKGYLKEAFAGDDKPFFGTKVSHYPPCPRPDLIKGIRAHTDAGGIILLFQDDEVPGLQVLSNGNWIDVQPIPHSIVIDIGDQLEAISGGKYKSAWHRILPTENGNRLSVASFYNPSYSAMIYPAVQTKSEVKEDDGGHDLCKYPKFQFGDYMSVYVKEKYEDKGPRFRAMREMTVG